jgi:predicted DNA binding CopG/RHH family protein
MMATKKSRIPRFRSDREERAFWANHSLEELADELEDLDVQIRPARTEQIALRLTTQDLDALRVIAKARGVGHTTLARSVLERWLGTVREKVPSVHRRRRPAA